MSDLFEGLTDMSGYYGTSSVGSTTNYWELPSDTGLKTSDKSNTDLSFEDMLMLMVTQLQNQTIDNQADTNDMMNQLISMTVMQALTEVSAQVQDLTDANVMSYAASLVGKEVTVGVLDAKTGLLANEIVGEVTATGTYNGQQVIFIGDRYFPLSSIMAVGTLPEKAVDGTTGAAGSTTNPDEDTDESVDDAEGTEGAGDASGAGSAEDAGEDAGVDENKPVEETGGDQTPTLPVEDYEGESGTDAAETVNGTETV